MILKEMAVRAGVTIVAEVPPRGVPVWAGWRRGRGGRRRVVGLSGENWLLAFARGRRVASGEW